MINCRRPSNKSRKLTLPSGPSNLYFFSTAIHGIRLRSAASASLARVKAFSFTRSCCHAASHSCGDTTGGVFIVRCSFSVPLFVAISVLLMRVLLFHRCCPDLVENVAPSRLYPTPVLLDLRIVCDITHGAVNELQQRYSVFFLQPVLHI